jgi:Right handed beta helix region
MANQGIYTDTRIIHGVQFYTIEGFVLPLAGTYSCSAYMRGNPTPVFMFNETDGTLDASLKAIGKLSLNALPSQHQPELTAGLYRLHLKRVDSVDHYWAAEGEMLVGNPGDQETYIRFENASDGSTAQSYAVAIGGPAGPVDTEALAAHVAASNPHSQYFTNFQSFAELLTTTIPAAVQSVRVENWRFKRVSTPTPVKLWHRQSADGAYWELDEAVASPLMMGAVANNIADDTVAAQAALDYSLRVDFGAINLLYRITATLQCRSGHVLTGAFATVRQDTAQRIMFQCEGLQDVDISGLTMLGKRTDFVNSPSSFAVGVRLQNSDNVKVHNNIMKWFAYSPVANPGTKSRNITVKDNLIIGPGLTSDGGCLDGPGTSTRNCTGVTIIADRSIVSGNIISDTAQGIIMGPGCTDYVVSKNVILNTLVEHGVYLDANHYRGAVTSNVITNTGLDGIKFQHTDLLLSGSDVVISNNTIVSISSIGNGLDINNTSGTTTSKNLVVSGNVVKGYQVGISFRFSENALVVANNVSNCSNYGLLLQNTPSVKLLFNSATECGLDGFSMAKTTLNCDDAVINGNTATRCGLSGNATNSCGFFIGGGARQVISNNVVKGDGGASPVGKYGYYLYDTANMPTLRMQNNSSELMQYGIRTAAGASFKHRSGNIFEGVTAALFNALPASTISGL